MAARNGKLWSAFLHSEALFFHTATTLQPLFTVQIYNCHVVFNVHPPVMSSSAVFSDWAYPECIPSDGRRGSRAHQTHLARLHIRHAGQLRGGKEDWTRTVLCCISCQVRFSVLATASLARSSTLHSSYLTVFPIFSSVSHNVPTLSLRKYEKLTLIFPFLALTCHKTSILADMHFKLF